MAVKALQRSSTAKEDGLTFAEMQKQYGVQPGLVYDNSQWVMIVLVLGLT